MRAASNTRYTPVELHDGIWFKREDLYRNPDFVRAMIRRTSGE